MCRLTTIPERYLMRDSGYKSFHSTHSYLWVRLVGNTWISYGHATQEVLNEIQRVTFVINHPTLHTFIPWEQIQQNGASQVKDNVIFTEDTNNIYVVKLGLKVKNFVKSGK